MTAAEQLREEGRAEGRAEGLREAVRRVLAARGLTLGDRWEAHLHACGDCARLERWLDRALTATRVEEVFADPE